MIRLFRSWLQSLRMKMKQSPNPSLMKKRMMIMIIMKALMRMVIESLKKKSRNTRIGPFRTVQPPPWTMVEGGRVYIL